VLDKKPQNSREERRVMSTYFSNMNHNQVQVATATIAYQPHQTEPKFDLFKPLRQWLDNMQVKNPQLAHRICKLIPAQCPFERDIKLMGRTIIHIPPMCKINPVYEELVSLRFRALCYLADECGEDISAYC
jgi:hypothetical protein